MATDLWRTPCPAPALTTRSPPRRHVPWRGRTGRSPSCTSTCCLAQARVPGFPTSGRAGRPRCPARHRGAQEAGTGPRPVESVPAGRVRADPARVRADRGAVGLEQRPASEAINCQAPDTGNMELLHLLGTEQQKHAWLEPLLAGRIRSAFAMTEPDVASSDATNIATRIERDGDEYVITGRKWWTSGAMDPRCAVLIVMGKTDPAAPAHRQQTMVLVPGGYPGRHRRPGLSGVRPPRPARARRGPLRRRPDSGQQRGGRGAGGGFAAAQARLGPGRIHHCMRALGAAERALALMVERAKNRVAFGGPLAGQGVVRAQIAESRLEIEQARLLCHRACHVIDTEGNKAARTWWRWRRSPSPGPPPRSSTGPSRCTAAQASPTSPRWPPCTAGTAPCGCSTAPTRCTTLDR